MKKKRWSPAPREEYSTIYEGVQMGLGMYGGFDNPALWNLFWLHSPLVDDCFGWTEKPGRIPVHSDLMPYCEDSMEFVLTSTGKTIQHEALYSTPVEFIAKVGDDMPPCREYYGKFWHSIVDERALLYRGATSTADNVIHVQFGKKASNE